VSAAVQVLLVDDHSVVRAGCRQLLEGWGGFAVEEAGTAKEAVEKLGRWHPGLVILDLNLPDGNGLELIPRLRALSPASHILVFTMHEDAGHAARALEAGAEGYVTKSDAPEIIVEAASRVAQGEVYLSQRVAQALALAKMARPKDPLASLTLREKQVLRALGQGKTLAEIAAALGVSYKTAANSCSQIKNKLGAASTAELIRIALTMPE
jgi:two-component system invasion response regulator UvrY